MSLKEKLSLVLQFAEKNPYFDDKFAQSLMKRYTLLGMLSSKQEDALDNIIKKWNIIQYDDGDTECVKDENIEVRVIAYEHWIESANQFNMIKIALETLKDGYKEYNLGGLVDIKKIVDFLPNFKKDINQVRHGLAHNITDLLNISLTLDGTRKSLWKFFADYEPFWLYHKEKSDHENSTHGEFVFLFYNKWLKVKEKEEWKKELILYIKEKENDHG